MKNEYFGEKKRIEGCSIVNIPVEFYRQERDWTCSVACVRTAISCYNNNISEDEIIKQENLQVGGQYVEKMANWKCLKGITQKSNLGKKIQQIEVIYDLLLNNYIIICGTLIRRWHFVVVYGYLTTHERNTIEKQYVQYYDPYSDEHKLIDAEMFEDMWEYGYLAIKQQS